MATATGVPGDSKLKSPEIARTKSGRLEFLDAVRGIAALIVVIYHVCWTPGNAFSVWSQRTFDWGQVGVTAFFLVSGFVIPFSLERHGSLIFFWKGRLLRLFPLYWVTLFAALFLSVAGLYELPPHPGQSLARLVLVNMTMFQDFLRTPTVSGVYWTLPLEMIFYICCSIAFFRGVLENSRAMFLGALGVDLALQLFGQFHAGHAESVGRLTLILTSFYGTLVYRVHAGKLKRSSLYTMAAPFALVVVYGFWLRGISPVAPGDPAPMTLLSSTLSWLVGGLVFFVAFAARSRTVPEPFLFLGRISYSLYLIHPLVAEALPSSWGLGTTLPAVVAVSCAVAALSYRWIEMPLMRVHARQRPS